MFKLPFVNKSKTSNKFLGLEINSNHTKSVLFYKDENKIKILGYAKELLEVGAVRAGYIIDKISVENSLKSAIAKSMENLDPEQTGNKQVGDCVIGLGGSNCIGLTTTIRLKNPSIQTLQKKDVEDLYKRAEDAAFVQAQNEIAQITGNADVDLDIVTTSNVFIKSDDTPIKSLDNITGRVIEMALFNAFTPSQHIQSIREIAKSSSLSILAAAPKMYALSHLIMKSKESLGNHEGDFTVIEISRDSTDFGVVFGGGIVATKSIEVGFGHFVEHVCLNMGLNTSEGEKLLHAYISQKLSKSEAAIVQKYVYQMLEIWLAGVELAFEEFSGVKTFSSKIFVTGEGSDITDLFDFVSMEPWTKAIPFKSPPEFRKITFQDFEIISDETGTMFASDWIPIAGLGIIYNEMMEGTND